MIKRIKNNKERNIIISNISNALLELSNEDVLRINDYVSLLLERKE